MKKAYILWGTCLSESWLVAVYLSREKAREAARVCNAEAKAHFQRVQDWYVSNRNSKISYAKAHPEDDGRISLDPRPESTYGARGYGCHYYVEVCSRR